MKILVVAPFDPAGVCLGHRDVLRRRGYDVRVYLDQAFTERQKAADFIGSGGVQEMLWFAQTADIVQVCPGIGQPWSVKTDASHHDQDSFLQWPEVMCPRHGRLVAYFHGSRNLWAFREAYEGFYHNLHAFGASTLDYAVELGATYLPPLIDLEGRQRASLRAYDEPLNVIQTPTDPSNCHAKEFAAACRAVPRIVFHALNGTPHGETLDWKRRASVGFDHMRGSFSVNHLENCFLGLVSLVGLASAYAERMAAEGIPPMPVGPVNTQGELQAVLERLADDSDETARLQEACHRWAHENFSEQRIGDRLEHFYRSVIR